MTTSFSPQMLRAWSELSLQSARIVLPTIFALTRPRSVIDVGCLFGAWAGVCRELGVDDVVGVDGDYIDRAALLIPESSFVAHDLVQPLSLDRTFDLAINLEVANTLPATRADGLIAELCALAPAVLFSAGIPHQGGGSAIVNEQWPAYWAERFAAHGYTPVDCVRDEVWDDPGVGRWYAQNTLLFVAPEACSPPIRQHCGFGRCPARVHPTQYLTYANGRYQVIRRRAGEAVASLRRRLPG